MIFRYFCLAVVICSTLGVDVRLVDLEPNDAQQHIESQDQTLKYAPKVESNVPAVRYLGNEPHNVVEDIYLANQYHGQDGLGGYLYGYSVPDIAKTEKKQAGGDLRGAYNYIAGNGQEIKVEYWDDGNGFHQIDNVPKILPKQIEDNPEVKAAKEEHLRLWHEQAERNSKPIPSPYNSEGKYASGPLSVEGQAQRQQQFAQQQPKYNNNQYQPQQQYHQQQQQIFQPKPQFNQIPLSQPKTQYNQAAFAHQQQPLLGQAPSIQGSGFQQYQPAAHAQAGGYQSVGLSQQAPNTQSPGLQQQYQPAAHAQAGHQTVGQSPFGQSQFTQQKQYQHPTQGNSYNSQPQGGQFNYQGQQSQSSGQYQPNPLKQTQDQNDVYSGQYSQTQSNYAQTGYNSQSSQGGQEEDGSYDAKKYETEEPQGPPKGFFYNFDYPVGIIVSKDGGAQNRQGNLQDIYSQNKAEFDQQLKQQGGHGGNYQVHH